YGALGGCAWWLQHRKQAFGGEIPRTHDDGAIARLSAGMRAPCDKAIVLVERLCRPKVGGNRRRDRQVATGLKLRDDVVDQRRRDARPAVRFGHRDLLMRAFGNTPLNRMKPTTSELPPTLVHIATRRRFSIASR